MQQLLRKLEPELNEGTYVFVSVPKLSGIAPEAIIGQFHEAEGITLILKQEQADKLGLYYDFVAAWITLKVHSALEAVGLTAAFSNVLAKSGISCNVVAGYYHDHIFVNQSDGKRAMDILNALSET